MIHNTYKAMLTLAIAALAIVGCGKENVTDLSDAWTKAAGDLTTKLNDFKTKHGALVAKFETMKASANPADTAMAETRAKMDQMFKDHEAGVKEVETKLAESQAKMAEVVKAGKRADVETAWKAAEADYTAWGAKLDELMKQHSEMEATMNTAATAAATTAPATGDTTAAKKEGMMEEAGKKVDEAAKKVEGAVNDGAKKVEGAMKDAKKEVEGALKPNTNK
ncbi:MAG: hypothetical protein IT211_03825 [Armatimonadetes bacterium]|nr:hypothetical protein [Armatimonadota bacterium]